MQLKAEVTSRHLSMAVYESSVSMGARRNGAGLTALNCTISKLISKAMRWYRSLTTITASTSFTFRSMRTNCSGERVLLLLNCACVMRMLKVGNSCEALR